MIERCLGLSSIQKSRFSARYWRNIVLGFQTPKEAKEGSFVDK